MNSTVKCMMVLLVFFLVVCKGKKDKRVDFYKKTGVSKTSTDNTVPASQRKDLTNKGVGPVKELMLPKNMDKKMAAKGKKLYKIKCSACHKAHKKFIGPAPAGILERRTPEWVMNMILNPEKMVKEDPLAKALLIEYNGSPMANQGLKEEEARAILEYFRTLEKKKH